MIYALMLLAATATTPVTKAPPTKLPVLTLAEALNTARERQPQLRQAAASLRASQARADASGASLLPQLSASANTQLGNSRVDLNQSAVGTVNYNLNANVSQLLFDFGQAGNRYAAAKAQVSAQEANARGTELDVALSVRTAFFTARANRTLLAVAKDTLANQQKHFDQIRNLVEVGMRAPIDKAQAAKDLANARVALIRAQNAYETAKAQLELAMGVERKHDYDVSDEAMPAVAGEERELDALVTDAATRRPDLAALQRQMEAQQLTLEAQEHNNFPTLRASAGAGANGVPLDRNSNNWNAGLSLNWPLFNGGAQQAQQREARASLEGLQAQYDLLRQQMRLDLEQARLAVVAQKAAVKAAAESTKSARVQLTLAEGRYAAGVGNVIELADAQLAYTSAAAQEVQEGYRLATARAQLLKALGLP
jgi:outer membrane protein